MFISTRHRRCPGWRCLLALLLAAPPLLAAAELPALSLAEASRRAIANNPQLEAFEWRFQRLQAAQFTASLAPATELSLEAENILGEANYAGLDSAETTLAISSVVELGGKAAARRGLADARYALAETERQAAALDLLGDVASQYVAAQALQAKCAAANEAIEIATQSLALVSHRVDRGGAPEAERLRARAMLTQARLAGAELEARLRSAKMALATTWGSESIDFGELSGDLFRFSKPESFETLFQRVSESPAVRVLGRQERVQEADVALAQARSSGDIDWSLGFRHFSDSSDSALTVGLSMPLVADKRGRGQRQASAAEREISRYQRQDALLKLRARLFSAWQTYTQQSRAALDLRATVVPALETALEETRLAYERGRYSYRDWVSAQQDLLGARLAVIDAASTALLSRADIERITGAAMTAAAVPDANR